MAKPKRKNVQVALALVERGGRYLICRRPKGIHLGGFWELPGGKRLAGESWPVCIRRELLEEVGIKASRVSFAGSFRYRYPDRVISFHVFRCRAFLGMAKPLASSELKWVERSRMLRHRFPPANRKLLGSLLQVASSRRGAI